MDQFRDDAGHYAGTATWGQDARQVFKTGLCSENAAERISIASLLDLDARRHNAAEAGAATTGSLQVE